MAMMAFGLTWRDGLIMVLVWLVFVLTMVLLMALAANADAVEIAEARRIAAEDGPAAGFEPSEVAPAVAPVAQPLTPLAGDSSGERDGELVSASCLVVTSWGGTWGDLVPVRRVVVPTSGCLLN